jgi:anti-sigma regulatory factor (Ser/Thr protein kinase)
VSRPFSFSTAVAVSDASQVGEVRRVAAATCRRLDLDDTLVGQASLLATESATNVLRHGGGGQVVVRELVPDDVDGVELLALDNGPGIADVSRALEDGHSTRGSRGTGFGAMKRAACCFEVYTAPSQGTGVLMQLWHPKTAKPRGPVGVICVPKPGEEECGDAWSVDPRPPGFRIVVTDGLGHGPLAREAALRALEAARQATGGPARALEDAHAAARPTRGAALSVADVDLGAGEVRYAGFGNVSGLLWHHDQSRNMVTMNGTLGQGVLRSREFGYPIAPGTLLVLASDGLASRWSLEKYPGLTERHPALVAGVLYRDHWRRRDDVTVVVLRLGETS